MSAHVAMLMGGWSAEREVSLVSGKACAKALGERGYQVSEVDVGHDLADVLTRLGPDLAFNALHGRWGEDGCVQGLLEVLEIPYTHSGVRASAVAMAKPMAKELFRQAGVACADGIIVSLAEARAERPMAPPFVVKPPAEGSTVGVRVVRPGDNIDPFIDWRYGDEVMFERFVPGLELSVAVMADRALGVIEIEPLSGFYDYEAKYTEGKAVHHMPARVPEPIYEQAMRWALEAHQVLGCRGVSRADFRYDETEGAGRGLYILEVNTQPGMTPLSLVPEIASHQGIDFGDLVCWMVEDAGCGR
ncbi:MAG: D-alanine--D-alanine ligase [Alphaproteobacteria bacterium]|jgi:D-alanine-D-alanine ligase|nr:D-alanine--D-alanine ligase [Alphaproteobacteria bacterium]